MKKELLLKIVNYLLEEINAKIELPTSYQDLKKLYKTLVNMRSPKEIDENILIAEDNYLELEKQEKQITDVEKLKEVEKNIILWQGDITTIKADAIVNAGNKDGLGCFNPTHLCIDNIIHTNAGMRLRLEYNNHLQGRKIKTGDFIVCDAYPLPSKKVITTVGPQIEKELTEKNQQDLAACYKNTLEYAIKNNLTSIVYPSISTGLFSYPIKEAKLIAYNTVKEVLSKYNTNIKVVFNVYSKEDYDEYQSLWSNKKITK